MDEVRKKLLQIKINYLEFIKQTLYWYDPNSTIVLFSLLMEEEYITQEELMTLTGLSRSTISETLSKLTAPNSRFTILLTRKPNDKKKYFYTSLNIEKYLQTFFTTAFEYTNINFEFLPCLIYRLRKLPQITPKTKYLENLFIFYLIVSNYYQSLSAIFEKQWLNFITNFSLLTTESSTLEDIEENIIEKITLLENKKQCEKKNDSLLAIKLDYLTEIAILQSSLGRWNEISSILQILFLDDESLTQDEIMDISGYSRTVVSDTLTTLVRRGIVEVIKKPKIRKKFFKPKQKLSEYSFVRFDQSTSTINRIITTLQDEFLPKVMELLEISNEANKLKIFFEENIKYFGYMKSFLTDYFNTTIKLLLDKGLIDKYGV